MMISTLRVPFLLLIGSLWLAASVSAGSSEEGLAFLAENKNKEGVVTLPSELQYKVLKKGSGVFHPGPSTPCSVHYTGSLIDGTVFDSSVERGSPATFAPNQVISGWTAAMQLMVEGDKWELYIPSDLAYGDRGSPPKIEGGSVLVFQMEILKIKDDGKVVALRCDASTKENCSDQEVKFLTKIADWDMERKVAEVTRLDKILGDSSKLKAELAQWIQRRLYILHQLVPSKKEGEEEEEL
jgi:FKBP-type peptidyl-prolyl cis-trans isomerase FklB